MQVRDFNAAVQGQGMLFATGEDGVRSLAVASAILESKKTGSELRLSTKGGRVFGSQPKKEVIRTLINTRNTRRSYTCRRLRVFPLV